MGPVNILMVDDQPGKLLTYEAMLQDLGENLIKANSARDALTHLLRDDIAVVLMDVSMPDIDGFELAAMIRQHPRCERTPIIFVSAIHMSDLDKVKGYETGAVDYVGVPIVPEILRAKIRVFVELHRKTDELKRLNDELETRVRARTDELETSLARLKESEARLRLQGEILAEADRRKDEFLAMLAHELRNPLAPIRTAVDLMRRVGVAASDMAWARDMIERQVIHLVRLVDDLLDASRITRGKLVLTKRVVELKALIADAIEAVRSPLQSDTHEYVIEMPDHDVYVEADTVRITQVFLNLVGNAIKFTPPGGRIRISVVDHVGHVEISIRDNGKGIDAAHLPHIFEMFYQGDPAPGDQKSGLGLGLSLVVNLLEMHGGKVDARSLGAGQGSEFVVCLPVVALPETRSQDEAPTSAAGAIAGRRILIADDNRDAAVALGEVLRLVGAEVETVFDGAAAVAAFSAFRPEIVLLDIGMPVVDGYGAAKQIRRLSSDVLLIAMTGWGQAEHKRRAMEAGFDAHTVKPIAIDALLDLIASGCRRSPADA